MYLSRLKLWNFRKYGSSGDKFDLQKPDLEVPFTQGLNVLIGENDSGKTTIIDAIKLVLHTHSGEWIRLAPEDFCRQANRLRIECRFDALSDAEAMHFIEWLGMEGEGQNAKPYLKVMVDVSKKGDEVPPYDVVAGADDEGHRLDAEARHYLLTTYLKPLRDAKTELVPKRSSRLSQILSGLPAFKGKEDHELTHISKCFECLLQMYFQRDHRDKNCRETHCPYCGRFFPEGPGPDAEANIRKSLQKTLDDFFGHRDYEAAFGVMPKQLRNILEQFKLSLSDEELGLGSQNLLFIAAELLNLQRPDWSGLRLALVEELEAHLHPQAQMRVVEYLQNEAELKSTADSEQSQGGADAGTGPNGEGNASSGFQAILSTHSPNLASKVRLKNVIICQGMQVFPMGEKFTRLKGPDYAFLERFLDVTKANLFFAKGVILVEGPSEELLLPALARKIGADLTKAGVSIVNVGNKALLRYARVFQRRDGNPMGVRVAVVTDLDVKAADEDKQRGSMTEGKWRKQRLERRFNGRGVQTFVSPHWTLEHCIARSKSLAPLLYEAIKGAVAERREDGRAIKAITGTWEAFFAGKEQMQIARDLYEGLIIGRDISKPIVAQRFAAALEDALDLDKDSLSDKDSTGYLIDAIHYATSLNNNQ